MKKRTLSQASIDGGGNDDQYKKARNGEAKPVYNRIASKEEAAAVDANPPLEILSRVLKKNGASVKDVKKGECVAYWMRMEDLRIVDNRALSRASSKAQQDSVPLIVLFVISPQDYKAHDRGARRIDFMLRNVALLKESLSELHIPLHTVSISPRKSIPSKVISLLQEWRASGLYANISYEVDELRRDIQTCELGTKKGMRCVFVQDRLIIDPGILKTKEGKVYSVYSPWQRQWLDTLNQNLDWLSEAPAPQANNSEVRQSKTFGKLFDSPVPEFVEGYQCEAEDGKNMTEFWPAGTEAASQMLDRFLNTKARKSQIGEVSPLTEGAESSAKQNRISEYAEGRNRVDLDTSSRLSPYLTSGVISARECVRRTMTFLKAKQVKGDRGSGVGMWVQEIAWRDFYNHILAAAPRVSMGRPYHEKYANVKWETSEKHFQAWKEGRTGVPIVDAAMRQMNVFGWMHNRCRMIVAMYLTKDLMIDWRLGERYFSQNLLDGDLASNNGGWQWAASTGTDAQPYFRVFNPVSQSMKCDPDGAYLRRYVTELAKVKGKEIHDPSPDTADAHRYPRKLVDHKEARERALRRYKEPGSL
ncbi:hypothetical protein SCHPADRAFT_825455 [Schizopora paradoxa]|uniref:Photolyase/cryptochrome alpha/beta domain-containing protein n=1 Tax=Schizopora paradoxa TaxID=27342 RepID=A0A0H2RTQ3_9AGAM|nr:hypothetical protein SCHPADRAFT_825455 [Schizopora paradoxa]